MIVPRDIRQRAEMNGVPINEVKRIIQRFPWQRRWRNFRSALQVIGDAWREDSLAATCATFNAYGPDGIYMLLMRDRNP